MKFSRPLKESPLQLHIAALSIFDRPFVIQFALQIGMK